MIFLKVFFLTVLQNASFTLVSRARNSTSIIYHASASVISNLMYILVLKSIVTDLERFDVIVAYVVGSVVGSVIMHHMSMNFIEKKLSKHEKESNHII